MKRKMHVKDVIEAINTAPIYKLLKSGKRISSNEYAVKYYYNKKHPKFYLNKEALRHALRREVVNISIGRNEYKLDIIREELGLEDE